MPTYKDSQNNLHALDGEEFEYLLPPGCVKLTADEVEALRAPTVAKKEAEALAAASSWCDRQGAALSAGYPEAEVKSWFKQETEARAWTANRAAATPLLSAMATQRGITMADLVQRVLAKADLFAAAAGVAIGEKQAKEDQIAAIVTGTDTDSAKLAALQAIIDGLMP